MIPSSKVLWGEGLFLRPQHFQQQDNFHEWRLSEALRALHPCAWGLRRLTIDRAGLASGVLRLEELALVFPDGEFCSAPGEDPLPVPMNLAGLPAEMTEVEVVAACAPLMRQGGNANLDAEGPTGAEFVEPEGPLSETKVVPAGSVSEKVAFALLGPLFVSVIFPMDSAA